ncbi:FFLEELY motif protein [Sulfuritalea hydrogenivorans]|uniref:DUF8198 domain-containing protein n=1 Tax=Sulfuritalea hydrogenivorans sk43H TaxID=1223802 RepID=W0SHP9_9PROT|nr:hypothetical protein [Sulfuritalea hydrogenivorans]BAO30395.1 hypothetical protein SUTH_02613 [Sulfuritalea hydrogenivorans sk43H]
MDEELDKEAIGKELAACIAEARELRAACAADPNPEDFPRLKEWQAARLARSYGDLLASKRYKPAAEFFLSDLYGPKDFRTRDEELARVVPVMVHMLPAKALLTLLEAVKMDTLSESLDSDMVLTLRKAGKVRKIDWPAYVAAYRTCDRKKDREMQIALIDKIGKTLDRLTRMRLIHVSLKLMNGPAHLAGLGALHSFLQRGFDAFSEMKGADEFLAIVIERETALMKELFANPNACRPG